MPEDTNVGLIQEWLDQYDGDYVCSRLIYRDALGRDSEKVSKKKMNPLLHIRQAVCCTSAFHRRLL